MRKRTVPKLLGLVVLIGLLSTSPARADEVYGTVRGVVTDPSGAVIAGVKVTATNVDTGVQKTVTSGPDGSYEIVQLPAPATYRVTAKQAGFKVFAAHDLQLGLNQIYVLDISMEVGGVTQEVTVKAAPAQVEGTSMQLGASLTGSQIVDLPLNGRDWIQLQQTLPGVVASIDFPDNFSTSGSRAQDNGFLVNGTDANDLALNTPLVVPSPDAIAEVNMITNTINPEYGRNGGAIMNAVTKSGTNQFHGDGFEFYRDPFLNARNFFLPQPDQFHQNQFGGTIGGPIKKDKSFFFFSYQGTRNREPQSPGRGFAGGTATVFTQDQRNGIFPDINVGVNPITGLPTASPFPMVGEDGTNYPAGTLYSTLFPTGHIPAADISPIAQNLVKTYMPLANQGASTFSWNPISTAKFNQYISRIDHNFSTKDSLSGYWFIEQEAAVDDEPFFGGSLPGFAEQQTERIQNMNLTWNHTFGTSMINEVRVGYNRFGFNTINPVKPVLPSSVGFTGISPQIASGAGLPCIDMNSYEPPAGACEFGFSYNGPQPRIDQTYQVTDNFTWEKGRHTLKVGFDMRRAEVFNPFAFVNNGYFQFYGVGQFSTGDEGADFLLGVPDFYEQTSGGVINARTQEYYSYFQDQWKIRPNFTLTYGLGWQINTPQNDIYNGGVAINAFRPGQQSTVFPTAPPGLLFPGDKGISVSSYGNPLDHVAPRLGFAWSPDSARKWSIRAGFGIYYNQIEEEVTLQNLQSPPFSLTDFGISDFGGVPNFANPFSGYFPTRDANGNIVGVSTVTNPNKFPFTPPKPGDKSVNFGFFEPMVLKVFDPNFTTPSAYNYNFTIERELPAATILSVGYVGHMGRHLEERHDINPSGQAPGVNPACAADPNCSFGTMGFTEPQTFRYDPTVFGGVGVQATDANSNYNSLQISATKKTTHGLQLQTSYTWSHSLDTISSVENVGGGGALNPFDLRDNYGDSAYDARNRFVIGYSYEIPSIRHFSSFERMPSRLTDGWRFAGDTVLQSGFPLSLTDSSENSLVCWAYVSYGCPDRPNAVGTVQTYDPRNTNLVNATQGGTTTRGNYYFNPNSFAPEVRGVLGNAGRNYFHGPGLNNFDFALFKDTRITERTKIELRFEFFNIFNHTQFAQIGTDINSTTFGRSTAAQPPRIIQLAAKFYF
ncbi:MAG TPA: carboxypeptidase-like regulatory domain-containing protein [Terriglobia bacterium]|nr:carboxypeptidase-like regulatory domain-containing protein [Terriglobia bacterium]